MFKIVNILVIALLLQDVLGIFTTQIFNVKKRPIAIKPIKITKTPTLPKITLRPIAGKKSTKPETVIVESDTPIKSDSQPNVVESDTPIEADSQPNVVEVAGSDSQPNVVEVAGSDSQPNVVEVVGSDSYPDVFDFEGSEPNTVDLVNQPGIIEECTTVADSANGNPELSILASALQATNLVDELNDTNLVATVLFPINKAFEELVNFFNSSTPQLLADSQTRNVLLYHIIPDVALFSQDLEDGATFTTLLSQNLTVDLNDGIEIQGGSSAVLGNSTAKVIAPDVEACNAVIHVIDKLLLPNFNLSDLQGASRTSPTNDLLDLEGANLTNLAPQAE
eukprot:TRINITY_DN25212_c0_g1_i10.p1 TRINITY_DN25212_c0_g1~~TRINITY_DN25212_c0_g1_i10.p1  ORF type:complete len:378 (+),score=56.41 TRINITY_DN25212_c0_g1_i10:128-1135(+)